MAAGNLGYRQPSTSSYGGDTPSRYIPSSVYSGPGPEVEYDVPMPVQQNYGQATYQNGRRNSHSQANGVQLPLTSRPRNSTLNASDPVAMHLLTEVALGDSKNFEILSIEELERLKREKLSLRNRVEATKRKIALEHKLRDAAQSLGRLQPGNGASKGHQRNLTGGSKGSLSSVNEMWTRADDEYTTSTRRIEQLTQELEKLEARLEDSSRRILEHTAGILQYTHRGLKKNLRKHELPQSPESMQSLNHRSLTGGAVLDDFDERSLYPVPDYVNEFVSATPVTPFFSRQATGLPDAGLDSNLSSQLQGLMTKLHAMILQARIDSDGSAPPKDLDVQAQIQYVSESLNSLSLAQEQTLQEVDDVNARIHNMMERTNNLTRSSHIAQQEPHGEDVASQLAFSTKVLEQLNARVESLVEHKDILTRQVQQQRELNSKSDAQRDAQIRDLTQKLTDAQNSQSANEQQAERNFPDSSALAAERAAREAAEVKFLMEIKDHQDKNTQLEADMAKDRQDAENAAKKHRADSDKLLEQIANIQTELTMVRAELDGAYGSRSQRAADVASNPVVQGQINELNKRNAQLQKELKETIEDYEQMTKSSIEFEKERDTLEASIDALRDKCEGLEQQLNEEKLKSMGLKQQVSTETTSTQFLKTEFKKMMRDTRTENMKALKAEQDERRRLEGVIRQMKKDGGLSTPAKAIPLSTANTPS